MNQPLASAGTAPANHTITRAAPADVGLDYARLVTEGTDLVQQMSGGIWTNYNYSDPGVTILEQLCYALTELAYRAGFAVEDLLGAPHSGHVALERHGLYPAPAIMPVNPVTPDDWRRLVLDRVPEVGNVWFTPLPAPHGDGNSGLYRIEVLARSQPCECDPPDGDALRTAVLDCYSAHRGLCEDVQACRVLTPVQARVGADVYLGDRSDPDAVLAGLLFALGMALAPEPKRGALQQQLDAGLATSDIFHGPLMLRGFIADSELTPQPTSIAVDALMEAMLDVPGVVLVEALSLRVSDPAHIYKPGQVCQLPDGCILQLQPVWRAGAGAIRLLRGGVVCTPNPSKVRRLLERAWAAQRRTYALPDEYRDAYRVPDGRALDLAVYNSVQEQFPAVYGIGAYGLAGDAAVARKAQAKQLKGYLMAADQLMANYFSQLAFVRELFSIDAGGERTYAWQSLRHIVPDAEPLLLPDYETRLAALVAANDPVAARQSAMLDFLLSLYAATLAAPDNDELESQAARQAAVLKAKRALLTRMVPATRDRGRGFDYRRGAHRDNLAGMEIRCRIELALAGMDDEDDDTDAPPLPEADDDMAADAGAGPVTAPQADGAVTGPAANGARRRLYIVEWVLLRYATQDDTQQEPAMADAFRCRISAVMLDRHHDDPVPNEGWRGGARAILRANTPAHIVVDEVFLDHRRMRRFVTLYEEWRQALRTGSTTRRRDTSRRLAHFLRPAALEAALAAPPPAPAARAAVAGAAPPAPAAGATVAGAAPPATQPLAADAVARPPPVPPPPDFPGIPGIAAAGASGAHVRGKLDRDKAESFAAKGFAFVIRDLRWSLSEIADELDAIEVGAILTAGLALMLLHRPPPGGWQYGVESGWQSGEQAVAHAQSAGIPEGVTVWLDLGATGFGATAANLTPAALPAFCQAWQVAVDLAGYLPGLYLPAASGGADAAFLAALGFASYWRAGGGCACVPARGACLITATGNNYTLADIGYDWTFIQADQRQQTPVWLQPRRTTPFKRDDDERTR